MQYLLSAEEVADQLKVSPLTVYRWAKAKELPHVKLGARTLRFNETDIEEYIRKKTYVKEEPAQPEITKRQEVVLKVKKIKPRPGQIERDRAKALANNAINDILGAAN
jgi:excisionase family DNA binding protein